MNKLLVNDKAVEFANEFFPTPREVKPNIGGVYPETFGTGFVGFDTTSGELFVEDFNSALEATVYALGEQAIMSNGELSC